MKNYALAESINFKRYGNLLIEVRGSPPYLVRHAVPGEVERVRVAHRLLEAVATSHPIQPRPGVQRLTVERLASGNRTTVACNPDRFSSLLVHQGHNYPGARVLLRLEMCLQ